jgi:hypothetical protein
MSKIKSSIQTKHQDTKQRANISNIKLSMQINHQDTKAPRKFLCVFVPLCLVRCVHLWFLPILVVAMLFLLGCPKKEPPRPKVVNPMIDSAEQFVPVFTETLPQPKSGLDLFLGILSGTGDSASDDSARRGTAHPDTPARKPKPAAPRSQPARPAPKDSTEEFRVVTLPGSDTELRYDPGTVEVTGVVHHQGLEGGFWGIIGDNGQKYYPLNLPEELKQAGGRVKLSVRIRKDVVTTKMWGTPVQILRYTVRRG